MPAEVLDKHDPAADTSKNPVLSRSTARYCDNDSAKPWGCHMPCCEATGGGAGGGVPIVIAVLAAVRRRSRRQTV